MSLEQEIREILDEAPTARDLYENSAIFKRETDKLFSVLSEARRNLSQEDYSEVLKWALAFAEEWK